LDLNSKSQKTALWEVIPGVPITGHSAQLGVLAWASIRAFHSGRWLYGWTYAV